MTTVSDLKVGQKLITEWSFTDGEGVIQNVRCEEVITSITEKRVNTETFEKSTTSTGRTSSKEWLSVKRTLENINKGKTRIEY
jgi:hypothetical protein